MIKKEVFEKLIEPFNLSDYRKFKLFMLVSDYTEKEIKDALHIAPKDFKDDDLLEFIENPPKEITIFKYKNYEVRRHREVRMNSFKIKGYQC